jgi:tetratricopeptide (TPR) repeat protein
VEVERKNMAKTKKEKVTMANTAIYSAMAEIIASKAGFGDIKIAESRLLEVLQLKPTREELVEAHNLLAQLYAQTRRFEKALDHFKVALDGAPEQAAVLTTYLAETLEKRKKWESAIEVYNLGLARCQDAGLFQGLAYCLSKIGKLD